MSTMNSLIVLSTIISLSTSASVTSRRNNFQDFTTAIFQEFKEDVQALIACDDGEQPDCPGMTAAHEDVSAYDRLSGSNTDKPLVGGVIRLAFHDCGETLPADIAAGESNKFQLSQHNGVAGGCNGCLDLNDPDNYNLLDAAILPLKPICDTYSAYISRADCWALAAMVTVEISAADLTLIRGWPFLFDTEASVRSGEIPYYYGRVDCVPNNCPWPADDARCEFQNPSDADFSLPMASKGWTHMADFFKTRFGWDSIEFPNDEYFTNKDIVALIAGAHSVGRGHELISGATGQWDFTPDTVDNSWISAMFNEEFGSPNFGPGIPSSLPGFGCIPTEGYTINACTLPYNPDECQYDPRVCPLPDGHPLKLPNGKCVNTGLLAEDGVSTYFIAPAFGPGALPFPFPLPEMLCGFFTANNNWNQSQINVGIQFGISQSMDGLNRVGGGSPLRLDPPLKKFQLALNTDMALLWDLSYYLENGRDFDIDCNSHAGSEHGGMCEPQQIILTAPRSQNSDFTDFNIGKSGTELGEIYTCPTGGDCCAHIQCPVQCEGGLKRFNELAVDTDDYLTLDDTSDCPAALAYRYSMGNKRQAGPSNRRMGVDFANAFNKMITIGYVKRKVNADDEVELIVIGDEDNTSEANLVSLEKGEIVLYSMLLIVGMVTLFGLCLCGYCYYQNRQKGIQSMKDTIQLNDNISGRENSDDIKKETKNVHFTDGQSVDLDNQNVETVESIDL